nr:unnamed protein product [uncultured bacterium]
MANTKSFRFSEDFYSKVDQIMQIENKDNTKYGLSEKKQKEVIEDAVNFYFNHITNQTVASNFERQIAMMISQSLKEYMTEFIKMSNVNQYNLLFLIKEVQIMLGTLGISKDDETMKEYLDKDWSFIDLIKDKIYEEKGVYLDEKD